MQKITGRISVIIPTYNRNKILTNTVQNIIQQLPLNSDFFVIDQTSSHDIQTEKTLEKFNSNSFFHWVRLKYPSTPVAMNIGLLKAKSQIVLFLDDDIIPSPNLIAAHLNAYEESSRIWAVAGQVIQPNESLLSFDYTKTRNYKKDFLNFSFNSNKASFVENCMAGNLSVRRSKAIRIGGFDENFIPPVSYRFETEFAKRIIARSGNIFFEPRASISHLRIFSGGTRSEGSHLKSISPDHGVGDYYYALKNAKSSSRFWYILRRPFREIRTKFHLRHPWWVPIKFIGEIRAVHKAISLYRSGPKYIQPLNAYNHLIR